MKIIAMYKMSEEDVPEISHTTFTLEALPNM
jgi:hypothetical protein